ncbi:HNH endonuclease [Streptomyces sp. NPDC030392]|uniref:HNH endonuclease n=1 Tax=Streptomyces sp. NPDC030392 TaxID=3155468 RepID=UPI0033EC6F45
MLIRSSQWKAGTADTPWHDEFDLDNGYIGYFGDHRAEHTLPVGRTPGNKVLLEVAAEHRALTPKQRAMAAPLLVFASVARNGTPKGYVEFCGVAVIERAEQVQQKASGGDFPNYRYDLAVLDLRAERDQVDWAWIEARGNPELSAEESLRHAPRSWRRWVECGDSGLPELRRRRSRSASGREGDTPLLEVGSEAMASFPPPRHAGHEAAAVSAAAMPAGELSVSALMDRLGALRVHERGGRKSRHKPLALLWSIARVSSGKPNPAPWQEFRSEVGQLLAEFGLPGSSVTPEYPFWHLRTSGLWEVQGVPDGQDFTVHAATFDRLNPKAGVTEPAERLLEDPCIRAQAVAVLRERFLPDVDQHRLMHRLGLSGHESASGLWEVEQPFGGDERKALPPERRRAAISRIVRDTALTARLKRLHDDCCQVCGLRLETRFGAYSEAAHIRGLGRPHHGPDEPSNVIVLCPNHHVQFDTLAIYVDNEGVVRFTADGKAVGILRLHPAHAISESHLRYHRALCGRELELAPEQATL